MARLPRKIFNFALVGWLGLSGAVAQDVPRARDTIWEAPLNAKNPDAYDKAVETLIHAWEKANARPLAPGVKRSVGLKIATHMGPGLATPKPLVRALAKALEKRGFKRGEIFLFDVARSGLLECGYIANAADKEPVFEGMRVIAFAQDGPFDERWFYDSPLPSQDPELMRLRTPGTELTEQQRALERKSFLPRRLFLDADFWINLPVVCDNPAFGIDGVLSNASIRMVSNNRRFLNSEHTGPVAMAEIAAIPEIDRALVFSIVSLEKFQFIGGPQFNSYYTAGEPFVWLSDNAVWMDYQFLLRFNVRRQWQRLPLMPMPTFLRYAQQVGLGDYDPEKLFIKRAR